MSLVARPAGQPERVPRSTLVALAVLALLLLVTAWVGDDCYFTLRTVDNLLGGHGPVWNVGERVQAYTHPLWMLVLTAAVALTGESYVTTLGVSIALSVSAAWLLARTCATPAAAVLALSLALLSRAFVDYGTGGLENPLAFFLLALFLCVQPRSGATPRDLVKPALVAALAALTRLDALSLYLPVLAWNAWRASGLPAVRRDALARTLGALALGFAPLFLWELFALVYYGFPFPNTAYAKLGSGLPRAELWLQGLRYLRQSLAVDPVTLATIAAALVLALQSGRAELRALGAGIVLHGAYVVHVGGDFMSGRFLALPFFAALAIVGSSALRWRRSLAALPLVASAAALVLHRAALVLDVRSIADDAAWIDAHGIADERLYYYDSTGLLRPGARFSAPVGRSPKVLGAHLVATGSGASARQAGPRAHVLEEYGLSDALLARLPARFRLDWRIGHFTRFFPRGYVATLESGENRIVDPELARYYAYLCEVTRGPLLARSRLRRILDFNLGRYEHLLDDERHRYPLLRHRELVCGENGSWALAGALERLPLEGVRLDADRPFRAEAITLDARGAIGRVVLLDGERVVWQRDLAAIDARPYLRLPPPSFERLELAPGGVTATALWIIPLGSRTALRGAVVRPRALAPGSP